ncbi:uncharacterized protein LOC131663348 [Phymastichus coffea]|uniref:uncharacterized protein LOC131663348 n=1 Tax=Phymastichus coffea TaxID=108790 RepID=UPI00273C561D|nr:uncharacterized protein LOC131663348 [Phymastichus coffea]
MENPHGIPLGHVDFPHGIPHDRVEFHVDFHVDSLGNVIEHDECRNFIETRYVGPVEACYRIFSKKLQDKSHSVSRLPIHLPNEQLVIITENEDANSILANLNNSSSMLLDYFTLNSTHVEAQQYYYREIPTHFTHKTSKVDAACLALGIIEDDDEWAKAMKEAETWMMPRRLRQLFVRILIHCQPIYPEKLWEMFKKQMSEDFAQGRSLADFPTMEQNVMDAIVHDNNHDEDNNHLEIGNRQYQMLNPEQKQIVNEVLIASRSSNYTASNSFYIDGQGGSGKTFLYTTIYHLLMSENIKCSTMAFTGIAATLLPNGKTEGILLKETKVFIWDEAPMAPRYALEIVNRTLKYIMNNDLPFGGKILVLGGDFRQLLPIKVKGTRDEILNLSIKNSHLWTHFVKYQLHTNMRVLPHEIEFAKYLLDVGNGTLNDQDNNIELPQHCILPGNECIVQNIFGTLITNKKFDEISNCAILSTRNADVDDMNDRITNLLDKNSEHIYTGIDSTENCDNGEMGDILLPEYLNSLNPPNFPPHILRLRRFCIVMKTLKNLNYPTDINTDLSNLKTIILKKSEAIQECLNCI